MNTQKNHRFFFHLICLTLALTMTVGSAQASPIHQTNTDFTAIDAYVREQMDALGIPGVALGIIQDGQATHLQGFGAADASGRPVTPQTPFYIGSITKSFTSLAVMQLVEEGKIDLDAPVQTYLPWFRLADAEASSQITVRHLLTQTTGMSEKDGNRIWATQQGMEEAVRNLTDVELTYPVGTTYQYCNFNFIIAGLIVEKVSGLTYEEYVIEHIFQPLDMQHSYASVQLAQSDDLSDGHYNMFGKTFTDNREMPPVSLATGQLIISVEDLSHFAIAHMNDGQYGDATILSPQGIEEMFTPAVEKWENAYWGMGWDVGTLEDWQIASKVGDTGTFHAAMLLVPEINLSVILLANASGFSQMQSYAVDQIAIGVLNILNGLPASPASIPFIMNFLYWLILLTPVLQIAGAVVVWVKHQQIKLWGAGLIIILNIVVVFAILFSAQMHMPLASLAVFNPEVGYAAIGCAVIGIGWSVVYTVISLRM